MDNSTNCGNHFCITFYSLTSVNWLDLIRVTLDLKFWHRSHNKNIQDFTIVLHVSLFLYYSKSGFQDMKKKPLDPLSKEVQPFYDHHIAKEADYNL